MPQATVDQILKLIEQLPDDDRVILEKRLSAQIDHDWAQAVDENRRLASAKGIDDAAIERAIKCRRYGE